MTAPSSSVTTDAELPDESSDEARLMTHAYDGIREYDNPLPGWWKSIFIGSIIFSAFYVTYLHLTGWGQLPDEEYRAELADYESKKDLRDRAMAAHVSEGSLATASHDPKVVERGAQVFKTKCVSCHAEDGRGLIGPNLTDLQQIHGATRMELHATITKGVPGTAMLAWGDQLPQTDILAVAAFAITLRGQNIAGKSGQGASVQRFDR